MILDHESSSFVSLRSLLHYCDAHPLRCLFWPCFGAAVPRAAFEHGAAWQEKGTWRNLVEKPGEQMAMAQNYGTK